MQEWPLCRSQVAARSTRQRHRRPPCHGDAIAAQIPSTDVRYPRSSGKDGLRRPMPRANHLVRRQLLHRALGANPSDSAARPIRPNNCSTRSIEPLRRSTELCRAPSPRPRRASSGTVPALQLAPAFSAVQRKLRFHARHPRQTRRCARPNAFRPPRQQPVPSSAITNGATFPAAGPARIGDRLLQLSRCARQPR